MLFIFIEIPSESENNCESVTDSQEDFTSGCKEKDNQELSDLRPPPWLFCPPFTRFGRTLRIIFKVPPLC